jgi:hypothetical protein
VSADLQPRTPISDAIKASVADAFRAVPDGKSGALLVIADENGARLHAAFRVGSHWKIGAVVGKPWDDKPYGYVAVTGYW